MRYFIIFLSYERLESTNGFKNTSFVYADENFPQKNTADEFVKQSLREKYGRCRFLGITGITEVTEEEAELYS